MATPTIKLEHELSTGVWTDFVADRDVLMRETIRWSRGIFGSGPLDVVADVGVLEYALNNSAANSGGLQGYYSPANANLRSGFGRGTKVRLHIDAGGGVSSYVWAGRLHDVKPTPGSTGTQETRCMAQDYMAVLHDLDDLRLTLREGQRNDQLVDAVLSEADEAPANKSLDTALGSPEFAFDDLGGRNPRGITVARDIGYSEGFGYLYVKGDATDGETLRWEDRHTRTLKSVDATFSEGEMLAMEVPSSRDSAINDVAVSTFPRAVGASTEVLVSANAEIEVGSGATRNVFLDYRDPDQRVAWIGGKSVVTPVANTDYTANDASGGGGSDVTSDIAIVATKFASTVLLAITNNGTGTAYVRGPGSADGLQVRGTALRRFQPFISKAQNASSVSTNGRQGLTFPMPYEGDENIGQGVADYVANIWGDVGQFPTRVRVVSEDTSVLQKALALDIGDRIKVSETVTGLSSVECFINGIEGEINRGLVALWFTLAPADPTSFLITDDPVAGRVDFNAVGYP